MEKNVRDGATAEMSANQRFGAKVANLSIPLSEVIPDHKMVKPNHKIKITIRPGLWIYTSNESNVKALKKKYANK